ncbi:Cobyrinic acid a,c-diamide synthase [Roseibium aggregatum IAM 12614]|uniref:Cobyrinic acid a,c-diamide synthase n=1 Tax=Roseibium aggregatum (strain ATCC 25650 / DSM 13394 / JCM 20685 / NBRC 16684 / NCIMB 2208 / IAM 12614 / B1) TaxID=384765 RepID=A0NSF3_ROSAI|nr:ParA family protein [Roseibium aggregatum]EAV44482.1 Cobyrinic acid a,c-diamide synthase [Roseibium aggregatum IAM 12614]
MHVVSIINYKGGVGKTSLTANLGAELAWRGKRVLLIDLDAQASLTFSFITPDVWRENFENSGTIKGWFDAHDSGSPISLEELVASPARISQRLGPERTLDIIYSHLGLINVDLELATKLGGANLSQAKKNFINVHRRLAEGLRKFSDGDVYDVVLIDCPPNFNIVTKTAIIASDFILVPTRPDGLSTLGIDYLMRSIHGLVKDYNDFVSVDPIDSVEPIEPAVVGVVFTMIQEYDSQPISAQRNYIARVKRDSGLPIFNSYIKRNDTLFADAPEYGVPVVLTSHKNDSHQSVVDGLEEVATEFAKMIGI